MNNNKIVVIDPGHGGFDPGGGSNSFFKEKDKTLQISLYQKNRLDELGIKNIIVRNTDETLNPKDRIDRINSYNLNDDYILLSNHINSGNDVGGEVIYSIRSKDTLPNLIAKNLKETGLPIRNVYTRTGRTGKDYYFILRDTMANDAMIIEYGFATNSNDTNRLIYEWFNLAESVVRALCEYLGIKYIPPKYKLYVVRKNDSLDKIANMFNTNIDSIKTYNNLQSSLIYPGQILKIKLES